VARVAALAPLQRAVHDDMAFQTVRGAEPSNDSVNKGENVYTAYGRISFFILRRCPISSSIVGVITIKSFVFEGRRPSNSPTLSLAGTLLATFAAVMSTSLAPMAQDASQKPVPNQAARPQRTEAEARALAEKHRAERARVLKETGKPAELISDYVRAQMLPVPASLGVSPFYTKYVDAQGIPVLASDKVPDAALLVARDIVNSMLAMRPDFRKAMIARKWRTGVIAEVEMTMDIPEYANMKRPGASREEPVNQADRDYHANRSRGLGGNPTTGAEENLLGYPNTRYWGEHIFVHEFAHAIMGGGIRDVDPAMFAEIRTAYDEAMAAGKYVHTDGRKHYATTNAGEYWAEGVQWWFFSNYGECFAGSVKVETPEEFAAYDPKLNELISRVFNTHQIPMDVFHGKKIRPVKCP
jgi:hypothetical protein